MNNEAPFKVGDEVICVIEHKSGIPKKGDCYIIQGLFQHPCCKGWMVDYGDDPMPILPGAITKCTCNKCKVSHDPFPTNNHVAPSRFFRRIEKLYEKSVSKELAEQAMKDTIEVDVVRIKEPGIVAN